MTGEKGPQYITPRLLDALGGKTVETPAGKLIEKYAYLWGLDDTENKDLGKGIFNHLLLASRVGYTIGKLLKEKGIPEFKDINLQYVVEATILHDINKLYGEQREKLPPEAKKALGLDPNYKELSDESDRRAAEWVQELGFAPEVREAIQTHKSPQEGIKNPYWTLVVLSDAMTSQRIMPPEERLADIKERWIDKPLRETGKPRMDEEGWKKEREYSDTVRDKIFPLLGITPEELIETYQLNNPESQTRWEKFLRKTRTDNTDVRAKHLVKYIWKILSPTAETLEENEI